MRRDASGRTLVAKFVKLYRKMVGGICIVAAFRLYIILN